MAGFGLHAIDHEAVRFVGSIRPCQIFGSGLQRPFFMKQWMKLLAVVFSGFLLSPACYADSGCDDTADASVDQMQCADKANDDSAGLPKDAQIQVNDLTAKMRYFKAIGFHEQSAEARDQIVEIYAEHGVPVPDGYTKWQP